MGRVLQRIRDFVTANPNRFSGKLVGGNYNFQDPGGLIKKFITDRGKCAYGRCDNGLDFSHEGKDFLFHRDTANPYRDLADAVEHFAVDYVYGNLVDVVPR